MFKNAGIAPNNVYFSKEWVDTGLLTVKEEAGVDVQPKVPTPTKAAPVTEGNIPVEISSLKDGDTVYDKNGTKFIFRGLRQPGQTGAGSPRLERTDGSGEIAIPGEGIQLFKDSLEYDPAYGVTEEEWNNASDEEKRNIKEC
jgi:hypothetical protein